MARRVYAQGRGSMDGERDGEGKEGAKGRKGSHGRGDAEWIVHSYVVCHDCVILLEVYDRIGLRCDEVLD